MVVHRGGGEIRGNKSEDRVWGEEAPLVLVFPPVSGVDVLLTVFHVGLY
jgi:hypothetical protein